MNDLIPMPFIFAVPYFTVALLFIAFLVVCVGIYYLLSKLIDVIDRWLSPKQ